MAQEIKIGDKVKYKKSEALACEVNGHKRDKVYTVKVIHPTDYYCCSVEFEESNKYCMISRLELVNEITTEHPKAAILRAIADGKQVQFRKNSTWKFVDLDTTNNFSIFNDMEYRLKEDAQTVEKYLILFKEQGQRPTVSSNYYESVEEFKSKCSASVEFAELILQSKIQAEI